MTEESLMDKCHKIIMAYPLFPFGKATAEQKIVFVIANELLKRLEAEDKQRRLDEVNKRLQEG